MKKLEKIIEMNIHSFSDIFFLKFLSQGVGKSSNDSRLAIGGFEGLKAWQPSIDLLRPPN